MIAFDATETRSAIAPSTFGTPVSPVLDNMPAAETKQTGMIFLRRDSNGWLVRFIGMAGMSANELPVPGDRSAKLPVVLAYLKDQHGGKLAGAWLLVAP